MESNPIKSSKISTSKGAKTDSFEHKDSSQDKRRVVTVMFADISGFTTISEELEAEDVHDLINLIFEEITHIVVKNDGFIDKYIGDCLMAVFGMDRNSGDSFTSKAILSSLQMHKAMRDLSSKIYEKYKVKNLKLSIGLNTGIAFVGEVGAKGYGSKTVIGDNVNLADRMEKQAEPGTTVISSSTARFIASEFVLREIGHVKVKGKREKIRCYEVERKRDDIIEDGLLYFEGKPIPAMNYQNEMAEIESEILSFSTSTSNNIILLEAEEAIGSNHYLSQVLIETRDKDDQIYIGHGQCSGVQENSDFSCFLDLISKIDIRDEIFSKEHLLGAEVLKKAVYNGIESILDDNAQVNIKILENSILHFLKIFLREENLVCVFTDAQNMDEKSKNLVIKISEQKLNILFLFDTKVKSENHHNAIQEADLPIKKIKLNPITSSEQSKLLSSIFELDVPKWLSLWIYTQSEGKLINMIELLQYLSDDKIISKSDLDESWSIPDQHPKNISLPVTIFSSIQSRLDDIEKTELEILKLLSLCKKSVAFELLLPMLEQNDLEQLRKHLETLIIRGFITYRKSKLSKSANRYQISNNILKTAISELLSKKEKQAIHSKIARVFESSRDYENNPFMIAEHYYKSNEFDQAFLLYFKDLERNLMARNLANSEKTFTMLESIILKHGKLIERSLGSNYAKLIMLYARAGLHNMKGEYKIISELLCDLSEMPLETCSFENERNEIYVKLNALFALSFEKIGNLKEALIKSERTYKITESLEVSDSLRLDVSADYSDNLRKNKQIDEAKTISCSIIESFKLDEIKSARLANALARHYDTLGLLSSSKDSSRKPIEFFTISKELRNLSGNSRLISISLMNIGIAKAENGKIDEAVQSFEDCLWLRLGYNDPYDLTIIYLNLGEALILAKKLMRARNYTEKGLQIAEENSMEHLSEAGKGLLKRIDEAKKH